MTDVLLLGVFAPIAAMALLRLSLERVRPQAPPRKSNNLNLLAFLLSFCATLAIGPAVRLIATALANHLGASVLAFPAHGIGVVGGFALYFLLMELAEYWFHRAEHAIPWMWSVHSMHHADPEFDSTTAVAHHWLSPIIHTFSVSLTVGLLFNIPSGYVLLYAFLSFHVYLMHANVDLDFGPLSWLVTSPTYHRLHHSAQPEHHNQNFAFILPIFDMIFGTYRPVRPGERPTVGLGEGKAPRGLADLICWPILTAFGWTARASR